MRARVFHLVFRVVFHTYSQNSSVYRHFGDSKVFQVVFHFEKSELVP